MAVTSEAIFHRQLNHAFAELGRHEPERPLVGLLLAPTIGEAPQFGWFRALNASTRTCSCWLPVSGTFLRIPRSKFQSAGLRSRFRGCTPNVPVAGRANAAALNHGAETVNGP